VFSRFLYSHDAKGVTCLPSCISASVSPGTLRHGRAPRAQAGNNTATAAIQVHIVTTYGHLPSGMSTPGPGLVLGADRVLHLDGHLRVAHDPHPRSAVMRLIGELDAVNTPADRPVPRCQRPHGRQTGPPRRVLDPRLDALTSIHRDIR
jgi:hypothetical protein